MPIVEVDRLAKRYGQTVALDGVSFAIDSGEMFGLLGPNGAGKTTLLSILACLMEPSAGEARLLGQPIALGNRELRRSIGIVPQENAIYGELTARENLEFFGGLYGVTGATLRQRVERVLSAMGLTERADDRVDTFSGGMQRRLNLGAALVHEPRVVLLDEPTTGVDPQSRNHIFEEIRRLNATGVTIVYTSHYMEEVQALCRRVGIIDHGRLIACDTTPALLKLLEGQIRFRVSQASEKMWSRLRQIPGATLEEQPSHWLVLSSRDVPAALLKLIAALNETDAQLESIETSEPNLERVFLHLTGKTLRD